jgi:hypothetical protein
MRRWFAELWAFVAVLGLAAAIVGRWRRGQVVLLSGAAAPAIRLLALLIVFVQACTGRLRGADEGKQDGAGAGAGGSQQPQAGQDAEPAEQPAAAAVAGPALDPTFPIADEQQLHTWARIGHDRGWNASNYKRMTRRLATVAEGTGPNDPVWNELAPAVDGLRSDLGVSPAAEAWVAAWKGHLAARQAGRLSGAAELLGLLDAAEAVPVYDGWLAAYVWRRAAPAAMSATERGQLLARIERHARVVHALVKAQIEAGPVEFSAWRSKAAPPREWKSIRVPDGLLGAATKIYATIDAGTWETAATLPLTVARGEVELIRRGEPTRAPAGSAVTLRRLDVLRASGPATLRHPELGDMSLGAGATLTAWDAGERLDAAGKAKVRATVEAALAGDEAALKRLEAILPAAHAAIREAVAGKPEAKGAAGLRMLLALFDE